MSTVRYRISRSSSPYRAKLCEGVIGRLATTRADNVYDRQNPHNIYVNNVFARMTYVVTQASR